MTEKRNKLKKKAKTNDMHIEIVGKCGKYKLIIKETNKTQRKIRNF
jgi:hypothetical protein